MHFSLPELNLELERPLLKLKSKMPLFSCLYDFIYFHSLHFFPQFPPLQRASMLWSCLERQQWYHLAWEVRAEWAGYAGMSLES